MRYVGGCHCGAVKYEVEATIDRVMSCNCSICSKKGYLLTFTPASSFTLIQGKDALSDYQFNKKVVHHLFCKNCGVSSFGRGAKPDGTEMVAINVRCLENIDHTALPIDPIDGKSF
ncbi:MAG: GFA family protein [Alphaproteobacteria bacterium]